jgi:predicted NUDIX family NTP pyrophosphohydrolase
MRSCGLLLYRLDFDSTPHVWLGHMGGPFWASKDAAAWSIPKGEPLVAEADLAAARREFEEEIGAPPPPVDYERLGEFRQSSGKVVVVFTGRVDDGDDVEFLGSNDFELEWPPRSGRMQNFPEIDAADWFPIGIAREKIVKGQLSALDALERRLAG